MVPNKPAHATATPVVHIQQVFRMLLHSLLLAWAIGIILSRRNLQNSLHAGDTQPPAYTCEPLSQRMHTHAQTPACTCEPLSQQSRTHAHTPAYTWKPLSHTTQSLLSVCFDAQRLQLKCATLHTTTGCIGCSGYGNLLCIMQHILLLLATIRLGTGTGAYFTTGADLGNWR